MLNLYRFFTSLPLLFVTLDLYNEGVQGKTSKEDAEQHLELGKQLLAAGQLADALSHYNAAIDGDPENYQSYFRRATVYLAMGKSKTALPDLDKCIQLKPDFTAARTSRANVLMKQGKLDSAKKDYEAIHCPWYIDLRNKRADCYLKTGQTRKAIDDIRPAAKMIPDNTDAYYKLSTLHYSLGDLEESLINIRECLKLDPDHKQCFPHYKKAKKLNKQFESAQQLMDEGRYEDAKQKLEATMKTEDQVPEFRRRARQQICTALSKNHDAKDVCGLLLLAVSVGCCYWQCLWVPVIGSVCGFLLLAVSVGSCYWQCLWVPVIGSVCGFLLLAVSVGSCDCQCLWVPVIGSVCGLLLLTVSVGSCYWQCLWVAVIDSVCGFLLLAVSVGSCYWQCLWVAVIDSVCGFLLLAVSFQNIILAAVEDYQKAKGIEENQRTKEGLDRAQKLLKQSKKRDYYKILGVPRNARKRDIVKAYRKLAAQYHPDQYNGDDKAKAEETFINIAAAKEVLTDPEMRKKYDAGEDPLDPESQQHRGGQPFNPFGHGGPFNFKFHFN
uniref:LOW QUALITY PROTEIN: dnaJ homolog subfamily C member 3-like n=1 Tax=Saccoglossus kowalevskii TaxID=10224 RepID=A0ABM0MTF2_SACKO|nr:PREDICTED: LOW QUALITY PROTEIN: dnaJ homolog subfamily C member 3-like [Saccoglossus kowalevskii]